MKKNTIVSLLIILLLTLLVNVASIIAYRQRNMQSYLAAGIDKEDMLKTIPGRRIILVGGSNVAFGFKSDLIEQITGISTINMGLQGSLGIRFSLNLLKPYLHQGDIILISPEYNNFAYGFIGGDVLAQYLIINPSDIAYLSSAQEVLGLVKAFPNMHTSAIQSMINDYLSKGCFLCKSSEEVYFRQAFDQYGDITVNQVENSEPITSLKLALDNQERNTAEMIAVLNRFYDYAVENGIQVYLVYPSTSIITDQNTIDFIKELDKKLRSELKIQILGSLNGSEFSDKYMFNTYYHLNSAGSILHTQQVLSWICNADVSLRCVQ